MVSRQLAPDSVYPDYGVTFKTRVLLPSTNYIDNRDDDDDDSTSSCSVVVVAN